MENVSTVPGNYEIRCISFEPDEKQNTINASRPAIVGGGKLPNVSKVEKTIIVKKDGKTIRCKLAENSKLKKMSVVRKDKIPGLDKRFEAKYPEMRKKKIEMHRTENAERRERA